MAHWELIHLSKTGEPQSNLLEGNIHTWWLIPLSKWVITPVINGISRVNPLITGVITHLLSGMSHQVAIMKYHEISMKYGHVLWISLKHPMKSSCFPYEISISFMARRRSQGKDIARPVEHQLGIGQSCRFTGANSWFHGIQGRFLRQFYCKNKGRTIFLGKRMVELCWTIKISIYIYGAALATTPPPPHQWVWVDSIVWFFWSPPLWPVVVVWFFWSPPLWPVVVVWFFWSPPLWPVVVVCWYVGMLVCWYAGMYVCMCVCMYACMHVCMYACMHVCMHVCMYVRRYVGR